MVSAGTKREIKLILCPIDFSEFSARAYDHAVSLAEHYHAKLVAQHIVELSQHPSLDFAVSMKKYDEYRKDLREYAKRQLQAFVKNHSYDEIHPELVVLEGTAADSILSFSQAQKTDLIVMGTHGRRGYDRLMLGSVTDRVTRMAHCPVVVVCRPPHDSAIAVKGRGHGHHLNRILFCADFSENSNAALDYAISAAAEYNAELILLHVLGESPSPSKMKEAVAAATTKLDQLIPPERRQSLKIKTAVRTGRPYQQIIQFALESQIDLVSMGVRGHGTLDLAVFGSTTYRVMQLGPCPVLTVHS